MSTLLLTQEQVDRIVQSYTSGHFYFEAEVATLVDAGYDPETAKQQVTEVVRQARQQLVKARLKADSGSEARNAATLVTMMVAIGGPIFETTSAVWYFIAIAIAAACGYFGFKDRPAAGIVGCILMVLILPFTYNLYFKDRTSFIRIEMVIPILMAALPSWIVYLIIDKIAYNNAND
jgi:hypothetical protein